MHDRAQLSIGVDAMSIFDPANRHAAETARVLDITELQLVEAFVGELAPRAIGDLRTRQNTLPVLTQAQADARCLCPPAAFYVVGIAAGTVRAWASVGAIRARAVGPRGARLYAISEVCAYADRVRRKPGRRAGNAA